jgi:endo-1,4-beta-xylanase
LNEPFDNKDVQAVLGNEEMAEWFKLARQNDPDLKLFLNDYDIVERGGYFFSHLNFTYNTLRFIQENGGPVDGFGFQSHFNSNVTDPARVYDIFDQFAQHVNHIQVTEFDVSNVDEETRARYTRDFMTVAFSHPKMNGFTVWGFWGGRHWRPDAALIRRDWSATPSLDVWRDLIYREWWTDVEGRTNEKGVFETRGFLGQYEVEANGQTKALTVEAGRTNSLEL